MLNVPEQLNGSDKVKAVIQRVLGSSVSVDGETVGEIGHGLNILLGVMRGDSDKDAAILAGKTARLRVFRDEQDKMNLSVTDIGGSALVISQFTLCADCKKGNRPSYSESAQPDEAKRLYELFAAKLADNGVRNVQTGIFAADMTVDIVNEGPVTIVLDTELWRGK